MLFFSKMLDLHARASTARVAAFVPFEMQPITAQRCSHHSNEMAHGLKNTFMPTTTDSSNCSTKT